MATTIMIATFSTFMNNHFAEINANFDNLNVRLDNIEHACPKMDAEYDVHKIFDNWQKKFDDEFFNNGYAPITNFGAPTTANSSSSGLLPCALAARCTPQQPCIQPRRRKPPLQRPRHEACG